jgi:hypothetical protein
MSVHQSTAEQLVQRRRAIDDRHKVLFGRAPFWCSQPQLQVVKWAIPAQCLVGATHGFVLLGLDGMWTFITKLS